MLQEIIKYTSFGSKREFIEILSLLEKYGEVSKLDLSKHLRNKIDSRTPPDNIVRFLIVCGLIFEKEGGLSISKRGKKELLLKNNPESFRSIIPIILKIFSDIKEDFIIENSIKYDESRNLFTLRKEGIKLKYSNIRNLFIELKELKEDIEVYGQFLLSESIVKFLEKKERKKCTLEEFKKKKEKLNQLLGALGEDGERFVLSFEQKRLSKHKNINEIKWISHFDVYAGYDVVSFNSNSSNKIDRYIEVKSYSGNPHFFWSENEINTSKIKGNKYYLYLVDRNRIEEEGYSPIKIKNPHKELLEKECSWSKTSKNWYFEKYPKQDMSKE